jgi:hypothetical protein
MTPPGSGRICVARDRMWTEQNVCVELVFVELDSGDLLDGGFKGGDGFAVSAGLDPGLFASFGPGLAFGGDVVEGGARKLEVCVGVVGGSGVDGDGALFVGSHGEELTVDVEGGGENVERWEAVQAFFEEQCCNGRPNCGSVRWDREVLGGPSSQGDHDGFEIETRRCQLVGDAAFGEGDGSPFDDGVVFEVGEAIGELGGVDSGYEGRDFAVAQRAQQEFAHDQ